MSERTDLIKHEESLMERNPDIPVAVPLVDIFENDDEILLYADVPGVEKTDVNVGIDNGKLSLSAVRTIKSSGSAQWEEFETVEYRRNFSIPQTIDVEKVKAELKDGILHLHLPKSAQAKPRQIEINAG